MPARLDFAPQAGAGKHGSSREVRPECLSITMPTLFPYIHSKLSPEDKTVLVDALLRCPCLATVDDIRNTLTLLPEDIQQRVPAPPTPKIYVLRLLDVCRGYDKGFSSLLLGVCFMEKGTFEHMALEETVRAMEELASNPSRPPLLDPESQNKVASVVRDREGAFAAEPLWKLYDGALPEDEERWPRYGTVASLVWHLAMPDLNSAETSAMGAFLRAAAAAGHRRAPELIEWARQIERLLRLPMTDAAAAPGRPADEASAGSGRDRAPADPADVLARALLIGARLSAPSIGRDDIGKAYQQLNTRILKGAGSAFGGDLPWESTEGDAETIRKQLWPILRKEVARDSNLVGLAQQLLELAAAAPGGTESSGGAERQGIDDVERALGVLNALREILDACHRAFRKVRTIHSVLRSIAPGEAAPLSPQEWERVDQELERSLRPGNSVERDLLGELSLATPLSELQRARGALKGIIGSRTRPTCETVEHQLWVLQESYHNVLTALQERLGQEILAAREHATWLRRAIPPSG